MDGRTTCDTRPARGRNPNLSTFNGVGGRLIRHTRPMTAGDPDAESGRATRGSHGRHRREPTRQPRTSTPIIVVAALALVATVAVVGLVVNRDGAEAASGACSGDTDLRITASAPVAGVLKGYADDFDEWVDGR